MSAHRNIDRICIVVLVLTLLMTVVFMNGEKLGIRVVADEDAESYIGSTVFTANDLDGDWADNAYTTYITLDGSGGKIDGNGAYFLNGDLVISNGGWYVLSGTLEDGSIRIDADDSSKIWIRLNGVTVDCPDDACLQIDQADKVFLTLAEGTENAFTSGDGDSEDARSDDTGGTIFSHDDLTINGSGSLTVTAAWKHGIDVNDSLVITGGNITITAPQDGIHVNDSFRFTGASLTIEAGDDAIHSDDELYVEGGTILIPSCCEGLEAITIDIAGGDITVYPSDDGINANGSGSGMGFGGMGGGAFPGKPEAFDSKEADGIPDLPDSGDGEMPSMSGEMPAMFSGDTPQMPGETAQATAGSPSDPEETYIRISGGTITIINETGRDADGLDSNGSIYLDGGTILISLPGNGGNCAIDYGSENGGECIVTGGTVLAFGDSSMAEEFSSACTQCAVLYDLDSAVLAGTLFRVMNSAGEEVLSYTPACSYSSVAFSSPDLTVGEAYTVVCGETCDELVLESTAAAAGNSGNLSGMQPGSMAGRQNGMFPRPGGESDAERPAPPDGETGSPPQQNGSSGFDRPDRSGMGSGFPSGTMEDRREETRQERPGGSGEWTSGFPSDGESVSETAQAAEPKLAAWNELSNTVWILLGTSVFVLAAAILFAMNYPKH